jgi:hypothetical protein
LCEQAVKKPTRRQKNSFKHWSTSQGMETWDGNKEIPDFDPRDTLESSKDGKNPA